MKRFMVQVWPKINLFGLNTFFLIFANYENHFILQASSEFQLISGSFS